MNIFYNYNSEKGRHSLNPMLFWEYDLQTLDLQKSRNLVVKRVFELGKSTDFYACFDLYGVIENVAKIAQDEIIGLSDRNLQFMCDIFHLNKENTLCFKKKQSRTILLNS